MKMSFYPVQTWILYVLVVLCLLPTKSVVSGRACDFAQHINQNQNHRHHHSHDDQRRSLLAAQEAHEFIHRRHLQQDEQQQQQQEEEDLFLNDTDTDTDTDSTVDELDDSNNNNNNNTTIRCRLDPDSTVVTGLQVDLRMLARQARGSLIVDNNCQFTVHRLELFAEQDEVVELTWYSSKSLDVDDVQEKTYLQSGGIYYNASSAELIGAKSYTFDLNNDPEENEEDDDDTNLRLDYDLQDVGAFLLTAKFVSSSSSSTTTDDNDDAEEVLVASALIQKLVPGPAADLLAAQPTMMDNCLQLSDDVRLRWTLVVDEEEEENDEDSSSSYVDFGLEYVALDPVNTWMAFGPAFPGLQNRLMGGSDVVIAGFRQGIENPNEDIDPFCEDYYIGGYEVCTRFEDGSLDGVCRDTTWTGDDEDEDNNSPTSENTELRFAQSTEEGVAFVRVRRPLKASTPDLDHEITPGTPQNWVWARGPLASSTSGSSEELSDVRFHGYRYGELVEFDIGQSVWDCPPLAGVDVTTTTADEDLTDDELPGDDAFAQQFEQSLILPRNHIQVFWTLLPEINQIHLGARTLNRSNSKWVSIAIGESMTDSWAWVATVDGNEEDHEVLAYRMTGLDSSTVQLVAEEEEDLMMVAGSSRVVTQEGGRLAFETHAQWPLPGMEADTTSAPIIYAIGPSWYAQGDSPKRQDEHSIRSAAPTTIDFATGASTIGDAPTNGMLLAHGIFMWVAWLILAPVTSIASRYIRDDPCVPPGSKPSWIDLHKNIAMGVIALSLIGLILAIVAASDSGLGHFVSSHAKMGLALVIMIFLQNFFGMMRPPADNPPVPLTWSLQALTKRRVWSWSHRLFALTMLTMGIAATLTGSRRLESFDSRTRHGVPLSTAWIVMVTLLLFTYEIRKRVLLSQAKADQAQKAETAKEQEDSSEDKTEGDKAPDTAAKPEALVSPWVLSRSIIYGIPAMIGLGVLLAFVAVTFKDSMEMDITTEAVEVPTSSDTMVVRPTRPQVEAPQGCEANAPNNLGDGWCDDFEPFNTERCGWDDGDCCNTTLPLYNCKDPSSPNFGTASQRGWGGIIPRNPRYQVSREESVEAFVTTYNNYYEFGTSKDISDVANENADFLEPSGWFIDVSGLVENPMTLNVEALIDTMQLEERMYRHRCVEAWSITSPWIGFPLSKLFDLIKPLPEAGIVQFVSWQDTKHSPTQFNGRYPWPYTEALTMAEARNELTMLTVGNFQKPLTPSQGSPIRLTVPWKFGYKSIKSIEKISFLEDGGPNSESRRTFWSGTVATEYGFWSNINPEVPHRRWSQATERHYVSGFPGSRLDTQRMNGYQEYVDYLYEDIEDPVLYF